MNALPADLARNVMDIHGTEGTKWLGRLPALLEECTQRWSLAILPPFVPLSYNYVAPAVCADGREVVLKAGPPSEELRREIDALRLFDGEGVVQLLDADPRTGVLLLERLIGSMDKPLLIHGDLHEGNILKSERDPWLSLDPKGVVGDPAYDAAYFSLSQDSLLGEGQPSLVLARRVEQLAEELGFERSRILDWGFALSVLTGWWSYEDHGRGWEEACARAQLVAAL
jgi:streptomycin 6-kinase